MNKYTQLVHQTHLIPGKLYRNTVTGSVHVLLSINGTTHRSNDDELYTSDCVLFYPERAYQGTVCMWHSRWTLVEEQ